MTSLIDTAKRESDTANPVPEAPEGTSTSRPAEPPAKTRFFRGARPWRNRAIVLLMVAAASLGAYQLVQYQSARSAKLALADVELTAQPIPVQSSQSGVVTSVSAHAGDRVNSGQLLGATDVTTTNAPGHTVITQQLLLAPRAGYVVNNPLTVGSTLQSGASFVEIYDPADLQLVASVPLSYLSRVGTGMTAELTAPGVPGVVTAVLQRAVPRVGTSELDVPKGSLRLIFIASDDAQIEHLLPGLRFHGTIDTRTGTPHGTPAEFVSS
jgi:multidrug efflux pump subunit AcrA (membrane-fusion protein)